MGSSKSTLCVHAGSQPSATAPGVTTPIHTSTSFAFRGDGDEPIYPRYFNVPNHQVVAAKIAELEQAETALVLSSGMAAVSSVLLGLLQQGDHAVFHAGIYGGTRDFVSQRLPLAGVDYRFVAATSIDAFLEAAGEKTKLIYFESPTNPLLEIVDIQQLAAAASARGMATVFDNTFATPILQNPLELGVDVVIHSGTKYLNGHSDVNCGVVATNRQRMESIRNCAIQLGGTLDVRGCYLLERGLKTLSLRVERQSQNAMALAEMLSKHARVTRVHYPGLSDHAGHEIAVQQMSRFGGMVSFEFAGSENELKQCLGRLRVAQMAISLGGVETIVSLPKDTSHARISQADRLEAGISDSLVRVSVGIEDAEDLVADFEQALAE